MATITMSPANPRRAALGSLLPTSANSTSGKRSASGKLHASASKLKPSSNLFKTIAPPPPSAQKKAKEELPEQEVFGKRGVFSSVRGAAPPVTSAFGKSGVLEETRGPTPEWALVDEAKERAAAVRLANVARFVEEHEDAVVVGRKVRCTTTGHELPMDMFWLVSYWNGKKYKAALKALERSQRAVGSLVGGGPPAPAAAAPPPPSVWNRGSEAAIAKRQAQKALKKERKAAAAAQLLADKQQRQQQQAESAAADLATSACSEAADGSKTDKTEKRPKRTARKTATAEEELPAQEQQQEPLQEQQAASSTPLSEKQIKAMKVVELRAALEERGCATDGLKPALLARLLEHAAAAATTIAAATASVPSAEASSPVKPPQPAMTEDEEVVAPRSTRRSTRIAAK